MSDDYAQALSGQTNYEERRRFLRVRKEISIHCRVMGAPAEPTPTRDLSAGGLHITSQVALPLGAQVVLSATMESAGVEFNMPGRIVWTAFDEVEHCHEAGVCFVGLDPLQRENVIALVAAELPAPDGAERRRFIRLRKEVRVEFRTDPVAAWQTVFTYDISLGGFAFVSEEAIASGAALDLRIHLAETEAEAVEAQGAVISSVASDTADGEFLVSGKFEQLTPVNFERLVAFVSAHVVAPPVGPFNAW